MASPIRIAANTAQNEVVKKDLKQFGRTTFYHQFCRATKSEVADHALFKLRSYMRENIHPDRVAGYFAVAAKMTADPKTKGEYLLKAVEYAMKAAGKAETYDSKRESYFLASIASGELFELVKQGKAPTLTYKDAAILCLKTDSQALAQLFVGYDQAAFKASLETTLKTVDKDIYRSMHGFELRGEPRKVAMTHLELAEILLYGREPPGMTKNERAYASEQFHAAALNFIEAGMERESREAFNKAAKYCP